MDRASLAQHIASTDCVTFRGEQICKGDIAEAVKGFLDADRKDFAEGQREFGMPDFNALKDAASGHWDQAKGGLSDLKGKAGFYSYGTPSVADAEGCCASANPFVPADVAPIVLVMSILAPGTGSLIAAYYDESGCNCKTVTCGIFQMLMATILVGWIWSICQGVAIYKKSLSWADGTWDTTPAASTDDSAAQASS